MSRRKSARRPPTHRWWKIALLFLLGLLVIPILQVGCVRFVDPPGTPLMWLRKLEAQRGKQPGAHHFEWLPYRELPVDFLKFVLIAEDQRFFIHHGFDWQEIKIARRDAVRRGVSPRGASTITMQCARSAFLWQGRSWVRKALEAYYTFWMEALLSKRRILELYANVIEIGDRVYGVGAAAQFHFDIPARELTREQAATLAAMLPNPRVWNPRAPSPALSQRTSKILRQAPNVPLPLPSR